MNKKRYIRQYDFNGNYNGYRGWSSGYYSFISLDPIGLDYWGNLHYYIR